MKKKFIQTKVFKFLSSAAIGIVDPLNIVKSVGTAAKEQLINKNKESKAGGVGKWDVTRLSFALTALLCVLALLGFIIGKIDLETLKMLINFFTDNGNE